jgi:chromosome segregation ATPase
MWQNLSVASGRDTDKNSQIIGEIQDLQQKIQALQRTIQGLQDTIHSQQQMVQDLSERAEATEMALSRLQIDQKEIKDGVLAVRTGINVIRKDVESQKQLAIRLDTMQRGMINFLDQLLALRRFR